MSLSASLYSISSSLSSSLSSTSSAFGTTVPSSTPLIYVKISSTGVPNALEVDDNDENNDDDIEYNDADSDTSAVNSLQE